METYFDNIEFLSRLENGGVTENNIRNFKLQPLMTFIFVTGAIGVACYVVYLYKSKYEKLAIANNLVKPENSSVPDSNQNIVQTNPAPPIIIDLQTDNG